MHISTEGMLTRIFRDSSILVKAFMLSVPTLANHDTQPGIQDIQILRQNLEDLRWAYSKISSQVLQNAQETNDTAPSQVIVVD